MQSMMDGTEFSSEHLASTDAHNSNILNTQASNRNSISYRILPPEPSTQDLSSICTIKIADPSHA